MRISGNYIAETSITNSQLQSRFIISKLTGCHQSYPINPQNINVKTIRNHDNDGKLSIRYVIEK